MRSSSASSVGLTATGLRVRAHPPLVDTDVIYEMSAQRYTTDVSWDGC
ncbi:hypothetical protein G7085_08255 [Tessaracoccus sp. HDW20]|nr:hypothetical protein [Tessaracoccus coleopterorum]